MALREILTEGDRTLTKRARPVTKFDAKLDLLIDDMIETMVHGDGAGLAAPQVGILRRVFVTDGGGEDGPRVFINPEIIVAEGTQEGPEGCLSLPGLFGIVKRPLSVTVRACDSKGDYFETTVEGFAARCICHENDHLNGILFRRHSEIPLCGFMDLPGMEAEDGEETPGDMEEDKAQGATM
ncbi:MAG TPA: peptide deformylase [Clostridia bacterium]|nr:peptide deformylase [Clostridia bacterium]